MILHFRIVLENQKPLLKKISKDGENWYMVPNKYQSVKYHKRIFSKITKIGTFKKDGFFRTVKKQVDFQLKIDYFNQKDELSFLGNVLKKESRNKSCNLNNVYNDFNENESDFYDEESDSNKKKKNRTNVDTDFNDANVYKILSNVDDSDTSSDEQQKKNDEIEDYSNNIVNLKNVIKFDLFDGTAESYFFYIMGYFKVNLDEGLNLKKNFEYLIPDIIYPWWIDFESKNPNNYKIDILKNSFIENSSILKMKIVKSLSLPPFQFLEFMKELEQKIDDQKISKNFLKSYFKLKTKYNSLVYKLSFIKGLVLSLEQTNNYELYRCLIQKIYSKKIEYFWFKVEQIDKDLLKNKDPFGIKVFLENPVCSIVPPKNSVLINNNEIIFDELKLLKNKLNKNDEIISSELKSLINQLAKS